ncbi:MAG TPA: TonB-dependent receptor [Candidatus Krumholzibacteria bacterium]|nr:TonB-dependent receptor [Candidatus Krumholzibacteria bacterium]
MAAVRAVVVMLAAAACAALAASARAEDTPSPGAITGLVTDAETGEVLTFCNVVVDSIARGTITDTRGRFVLYMIPPGRYTLVISRIGHATFRLEPVVVSAGDTTRVQVRLDPVMLEADPIIVTASRVEQTARMAPASVSVVTGEEMARQVPVTFDRAIENVAGLTAFRSTGGISVQSISLRGSSDVAGGGVGNRVLLLIDGRPALTSDSGGAFWSLVPVQFVDRVEVVKGAFSSLYGSTAMGGVINVITRRPDYASAGRVEMKLGFFEQAPAEIRYTDESKLQSEVVADYSGKTGRLSYLVSASRKESDGYSQNTAYKFYDLYGKILYDISAERNLDFTLGGGNSDNEYPHAWVSTAEPLEVREAYRDDRQEKNYYSADLHYWGLSGTDTKYSMRAYYYHHEQDSYFNEDDPDGTIPGNEPFGLKTNIDGDKIGNILQVDTRLGGRNRVVLGADVQLDYVESSPDSIVYGDRQINNYAVFAQDDITILNSLAATIGGRYDWNHLVGGRTLDQLSPKVAMVWTPTPEVSLRALYGQAFRAPTIAELFLQEELGGGVAFVPNPDLDAEHLVNSYEGGVRWAPAAIFDVDVAAFRYEYEDMIYWIEISAELGVPYTIYQVRNLNSALMQGVETTLRSRWRSLTVTANFTRLDARDTSPDRTDDLLAYRPKYSGGFGADLALGRWTLHGDGRYRSSIDEVFLYPRQAPDEYWLFNGAVQCRLNGAWLLTVKGNNLLDRQYEELARYRMPGRNWLFGVQLSF